MEPWSSPRAPRPPQNLPQARRHCRWPNPPAPCSASLGWVSQQWEYPPNGWLSSGKIPSRNGWWLGGTPHILGLDSPAYGAAFTRLRWEVLSGPRWAQLLGSSPSISMPYHPTTLQLPEQVQACDVSSQKWEPPNPLVSLSIRPQQII